MAKRSMFMTFVVGTAAFIGCSAEPTAIANTGRVAPVVAFDPGPAAIEYQLTSFDGATRLLTGFSRLANLCDNLSPTDPCRFRLSASLTSDTWIQPAKTDRFAPVDPCRALAENYNIIVVDTPPDAAISALAAQGCNARVRIDQRAGTILQFQPVP